MNFKHPFINFVSGLVMMLLLVLAFNLVQSGGVEATAIQETNEPVLGESQTLNPEPQYQEEDEDEDEQEEEEWDEEENEHEDGEHHDGDHHDGEHGEHDDEDDHEHHEEIMHEFEGNMARLEIITRLAEVAGNKTATASYALMQLEQFVEDEGEAIDVLNELIESGEVSPAVKNLLKGLL